MDIGHLYQLQSRHRIVWTMGPINVIIVTEIPDGGVRQAIYLLKWSRNYKHTFYHCTTEQECDEEFVQLARTLPFPF